MTDFNHQSAWQKFKAVKGIQQLLQQALLLYVLMIDGDTPKWAKAIVIAALAYLIDPIDAIPDFTPIVGYIDDMAAISAAIAALKQQIEPHHITLSKEMYQEI